MALLGQLRNPEKGALGRAGHGGGHAYPEVTLVQTPHREAFAPEQ